MLEEMVKRKYLRDTLSGFVILLTIVSCAFPDQTSQPAVGPAVTKTSHALAAPTAQANLITVTPTIFPTKTLTPTPNISSYGTSLVNLADGSTQFTDHEAGLQIRIPSEWLAVRIGEQEYYQAWEKVGTQNPEFLHKFASIQSLDPNTFRMTAVDIRVEHILYEHVPTLDVIFAQGDVRTLNEVRIDETEKSRPLANYKLLSSNFQKTPNDIETVIIEFQWESATSDNQHYLSYSKRVLFKVPTGTVSIDLHIPLEQKISLGLEFDQIVSSMTLFTP